jgi:hypothetical protein
MLWICAKAGVDRKLVVFAACQCARLALKHVPKGEERPLKAIKTAEKWCKGKASIEEVRAAYAAAYAAADAAYAAYAAADAADAAADAAYAAAYAAYAAAYAAADAAYAAYAAADAAADAAWENTHQQCADLVRKNIPWAVAEKAWNSYCKT